jgi:hypothetical protein
MARKPDWKIKGPESFYKTPQGVETQPRLEGVTPPSGHTAGGATITLSGYNFHVMGDGTLPVVTVDGVVATGVAVVNARTLTFVLPAHAATGVVDIVVTIGTQSATLSGLFTYFESFITSIEPAFGPFGGGTTVNIKGYNFDAASTVTFGGNAATGVIVIDSQHIQCVTPAHAVGFVDVVITDPTGSTTSRNAFQFTLFVRGEDIRRTPGIVINETLGTAPNTCDFVIDGRSNQPTIGEQTEIRDSLDGDRRLFAGTVQSVTQNYQGQIDQLVWKVKAVDFTWFFNKKRPVGAFVSVPADQIVKTLVAQYAPGFTTNHVQTNLAKVTITLDGVDDLVTAMSKIAAAIGGGHWYIDYDQDVHFFHVVPESLALPPSQFQSLGANCTIAAGGAIGTTFTYPQGYYFLRHTFVYSDGTESAFGSISNVLQLDGTKKIVVSGIPIGAAAGSLTCVKRRLYYNAFLPSYINGKLVDSPIESIQRYVEINDNTTTTFTSDFGSQNATVAGITDIATSNPIPPVAFTGHPAGPVGGSAATADILTGTTLFMGGLWQFKTAFLYRDGSISFPSPASNNAGNSQVINGQAIIGFSLSGIPIGPSLNGNDVVARLVYYCQGLSADPGYGVTGAATTVAGYVFPIPILDPTWAAGVGQDVIVVPDNTTTELNHIMLSPLGSSVPAPYAAIFTDTPVTVGYGQKIYDNGAILSTDPIPVWPNNDGPYLEDADPPEDIDDLNEDLLHEDSGSQAFEVQTDLSQVRNQILVNGAGSVVVITANAGDALIYVGDITAFSPSGGTVKSIEPSTGKQRVMRYTGLVGVPGNAAITLAGALAEAIAQGSTIYNFYQADNFESQKFLASVELDIEGLPTDGIHQYVINDPTLKAPFQLFMRANAELERYSMPIVTIKYATRGVTRPGQTVHVDLTDPPCQGDFLVQSVTIDQVHDESDELTPRYTVTASSTRFELTDLLLQILQDPSTVNGQASQAGVATTAIDQSAASSSGSTPSSLVLGNGGVRIFCATFISNGTKFNYGPALAESIAGTSSFVYDSRMEWHRMATSTVSGSLAEARTAGVCAIDHNPLMRIRFRLSSDLSNQRLFIALSASTPDNLDPQTNASTRVVGVRMDSTGNFVGITWDGVTQTVTPLIAATASKEYLLEVSVAYTPDAVTPANGTGVATISLTPAGGTKTSITMTLNSKFSALVSPNPRFGPVIDLYATSGAARSVDWTNFYTEYGSSLP